jgi:hypothetical protein
MTKTADTDRIGVPHRLKSTLGHELRVKPCHDLAVRSSKAGKDMGRRGHYWDPLPSNDW